MKKLSKKLLSAILSVLMVLSVLYAVPLTATAAETETAGVGDVNIYGDYEYGILDDGTAAIAGYTGSAAKLDIPSTLDGYSVTSIGNDAFYKCTSLRSVTIPESVTIIGRSAFFCCTLLESVTIPEGDTSIGKFAFGDCTSLESITIPEGVTSIGDDTFIGCTSLRSVSIPSSVTSIGECAFLDCPSLESITIPEGVESIGISAFCDCISLASVTISSSVKSIGRGAFWGCTSLDSITVDDGNSDYCSVDGVLFNNDATVLICYPEGKSGSYTIPSGVTSIGKSAFWGCTSLESVTISEGVTSIGSYAFGDCTSLASVTISSSVVSIDWCAFFGCTSLESITVADGNGNYCSVDGVPFSKDKTVLICYPGGKSGSYTIPEGVESIGGGAFSGCTSLERITISSSVTSIGDDAFYKCPLKDIYYTGSESQWESIDINGGNNALKNASIHYNYVPSGNTDGDYEYRILDDGTAEITKYTGSATKLDIPSTLDGYTITSIGISAFSSYTSLVSITIPESVTNIGDGAFIKCTSLASVTIPSSVKSIGDYAFYKCPLKDVYYTGSESQWESININGGNDALKLASIHYNYVPSGNTEPDLLPGDANGDGVVNVKDATTVQKHVAGLITLEGEALAVADYDNNGTVNVKDATAIQKHVAGLI